MIKLSIPLKELKAAALFASRDSSRFILNSVCLRIRAEGHIANLYATDGRRMACIKATATLHEGDVPKEGFNVLIPTALIKLARPWNKKTTETFLSFERFESVTNGIPVVNSVPRYKITFDDVEQQVTRRSIDGRYPVLDQAFIKDKMVFGAAPICVNPAFFSDLHEAAKLLKPGNDAPGITLATSGNGKEIVARILTVENFYCLLMPILASNSNREFTTSIFDTPLWIDKMATPQPAVTPPCTTP